MDKIEFEEYLADGNWFLSKNNKMCLNWSKQDVVLIDNVNDWNELAEYITNKSGLTKSVNYSNNPVISSRTNNKYIFYHKNNYFEFRVLVGGKVGRFISSEEAMNNCYDRNDNGAVKFGEESYGDSFAVVRDSLVDTTFQKVNNLTEKDTIYQCLSGKKYKDIYNAIKRCVPQQISYINRYFRNKVVENCYKADVSSAFPSCGCDALPTLHDCKKVDGVVEPSKEYPFAFYIHSGNLAIYNELDTRIDSQDEFNGINIYEESKEEETILCKKSPYDLKSVFNWIYNKKNAAKGDEKDFWKLVINSIIGKWQKNSAPRLSMLSAVIIARNNHRMLQRARKLEEEGNVVLYIATDCITWCGKHSNIATYEKKLGNFVYEMEHAQFFMKQVGAYQIMTDDEYLCKCSYLDNDSFYKKFRSAFGHLPDPKHSKLIIDDISGKIIEI